MEEEHQNEPSQLEIHELEDRGKIRFRAITSVDSKKFNQVVHTPEIVFRGANNTPTVIMENKQKLKIYEIKDRQIEFVCSHSIDLGISVKNESRFISEKHIRYFAPKAKIEKNEKNQAFFKKHGISWDTDGFNQILVFQSEYGVEKSEQLYGEFLGEFRELSPTAFSTVLTSFNNQKPLIDQTIFLLQW